jgi:hypothetical protein
MAAWPPVIGRAAQALVSGGFAFGHGYGYGFGFGVALS